MRPELVKSEITTSSSHVPDWIQPSYWCVTTIHKMFSRKLQAWFSYFTAGSDGVEVGQTTYRSLYFSIRTRYRTVTLLYRASDVFSGPSPLLRPWYYFFHSVRQGSTVFTKSFQQRTACLRTASWAYRLLTTPSQHFATGLNGVQWCSLQCLAWTIFHPNL